MGRKARVLMLLAALRAARRSGLAWSRGMGRAGMRTSWVGRILLSFESHKSLLILPKFSSALSIAF